MALSDVVVYATLAALPANVACVVGYRWPTARDDLYRSAGKLTAGYVALAVAVGAYYLVQYAAGPGAVRADTLGFVGVYGAFLLVVLAGYVFVSSVAGLVAGSSLSRR